MTFLDGYKTYISAAIIALVALNSQLHLVSPEIQTTILTLATALGFYGLRSAIAKVDASTAIENVK